MEYVYFDEATSDMLLKMDPERPTDAKPSFCMDDSGTLLIRYFDGRKFVRNFRIPSSNEPQQTQKNVITDMQARITDNKTKYRLKVLLGVFAALTILSVTVYVMISLM